MEAFEIIFTNAKLYTFEDETLGFIEHGAMGVCKGKITWLGTYQDMPRHLISQSTQTIDCQGLVLTPGLIDCHTHLVYASNRAHEYQMRLEGKSYEEIHAQGGGIQATVKATRAADEASLFEQSLKRLKAMISQGVTTVEIKSGYGLNLECEEKMLQVAKKLGEHTGVKVVKTFLGAHTLPDEMASHEAYIQEVVQQVLPSLFKKGLVDAVDGFCEKIAFSVEQIQEVFEAAVKLHLPIKLHSDQLSNMGGTLLASQYGAISVDHLEYAQEKDIEAMSQCGAVAVLLPGAYYFLKETKKPPVERFRAAKIPMAIATDCNPGTSPTTSLILMLNMACTLYGLTIPEALLGVTKYAAKALNLNHTGILKVGLNADCSLWNISHPRDLVYHFGFNPCKAVYKQGKNIYEQAI